MSPEFYTIINIFIPLSVAFTALLITGFEFFTERHHPQKPLKKLLGFFVCACFNWGVLLFYFYFPAIFAVLNSLAFLSFIMVQVLFYGFIYHITQISDNDTFSKKHYILPLAIALFLLVLMLIEPFDNQVQTIRNKGAYTGGSYLFHLISNSKLPIRLIFSIVYTALCFKRLVTYQRHVSDYSSNDEKSSLRWVRLYLFLALAHIPIPLLGVLLPRDGILSSSLFIVQIVIMAFQYSFVCFHIIKGNYLEYDDTKASTAPLPAETASFDNGQLTDADPDEPLPSMNHQTLKKQLLDKETFEAYMLTEKPFLNPNIKITDLAIELNTNRSYLSNFINEAYKINFSRLINQFRMDEYNRLRGLDKHKMKSNKELVEMAGFGSYKNFNRLA